MKSFLALPILSIALFFSGFPVAATEPAAPVTVEMKVPEMVCAGCAWSITEELKKLENVSDVYVDPKTKTAIVEVKSDSTPGEKAILAAVKTAGYDGSGYRILSVSFAKAKEGLEAKKK
ncbi:MAG: heavy-metal-associated domain-containing protein [Verrucomicrobiales bacterium]|jgi:copper chaperone CopZ|nr:heavy-metal-associated domain-containing protein [Verrucomicrobiales bacterium]MBP9223135.1 heavy-metal-associated domain-containing protein [Verrucomicrobiales bacterium]HQZ28025.1 heavy-metal-associated domain-containing protein [Verrucomicrobiales bacterium]